MRTRILFPLCSLLILASAAGAQAGAQSALAALEGRGEERTGWCLGGSLGFAHADIDLVEGDREFQTGWHKGGKIGGVRLGYAVSPELVLSGEYGVWRRSPESDAAASSVEGDEDRYLGVGLGVASLYPRLRGFHLRAGLGWGHAFARLPDAGGGLRSVEQSGVAVLMGAGYDWQVDDDMEVGVRADFLFFEGGEGFTASYGRLSATVTLWLDELFL